jgi:Tfp pilus assembly protein PilF
MFFRKDGAKMKNDLSDILNIDPDNLDVELLNQPTYFYRYSKELEEAKEEYEIEKDALELKDVEIDSEVRKVQLIWNFYRH